MYSFRLAVFLAVLTAAVPSAAATISGTVSDTTGAALVAARVTLRAIASGEERVVETDDQGRYQFDVPLAGAYLIIVTRPGFSDTARTIIVEQVEAAIDVPVTM
jgi:hypothetical protein